MSGAIVHKDGYVHILTAIRTRVLPELGWSPRPETSRVESEVAA